MSGQQRPNPRPPPFPIEKLAAQPLPPYRLPTPPESSDDMSMDWSPSQATFASPKLNTSIASQLKQSSPVPRAGFRGHLPPDVVSPAHRLRNPPNKPTFRKASESTKSNFFNRSSRLDDDGTNLGNGVESRDSAMSKSVFPRFSPAKFQDPTFFAPGADKSETGLEGLLERAFSLGEPSEVRERRVQRAQISQRRQENRRQQQVPTTMHLLFSTALLALSYTLLYATPPAGRVSSLLSLFAPQHIQLFASGLPVILTLRSFITSIQRPRLTLLAVLETVAVGLLLTIVFRRLDYDEQKLEIMGKSAVATMGTLEVVKEALLYLSQ